MTRPAGTPLVRMIWSDLLFAHWPVPVDELRHLVPEELTIDTFDGTAWIGLVPFTMPIFAPAVLPLPGIRELTAFHECNVRTYVRHGNVAGVWFFSLDATSRLAVWGARRFWSLPYQPARISLQRAGDEVRYECRRLDDTGAAARLAWRVGAAFPESEPGSIEHFLTERYALYSRHRDRICAGPIDHERWRLRRAELLALDESLIAAAGVRRPDTLPLIHAAEPIETLGWGLRQQAAEQG